MFCILDIYLHSICDAFAILIDASKYRFSLFYTMSKPIAQDIILAKPLKWPFVTFFKKSGKHIFLVCIVSEINTRFFFVDFGAGWSGEVFKNV